MPKQNTQFSSRWYQKLDGTKNPCARWLKQGKSPSTFLCIVCNEEKSCKNGGWSDVNKHSQRPKHLQRLKDLIESGQFIITSQVNSTHERILTSEEKITRAEVYWAMATAKLGLSYNSSQYIQELFSHMFSDSTIAKEVSIKPRKLSYILSHGTGYYFTQLMLNDLMKAPGFTLLFDETINVGVKKQLDLHFRYWSERKQAIVARYYKSIFLGHTTAEILFRNILDSLRADGIDLTKILMLGRDNPNVNKAIERMIDEEIRLEREKQSLSTIKTQIGLIYLGSCPLHLIHNSFKIGIATTNWSIEELVNHLILWFRHSPSRRADYLHIAPTGKFLPYFTFTRWLDVDSILERVIEQWTNLKGYFLEYLPKQKKNYLAKRRYLPIKTVLQTSSTLIRLNFLVFLSHNIYREILVWFQQSQPLIHLLYDECERLIRRLFAHFITESYLQRKNTLHEFIQIPFDRLEYQRSDSDLEIGEAARHHLSSLSKEENEEFFCDIRMIYSTIAKQLIRTLPLKNDLLRHLKCLHPSMRLAESSHISIMNMARRFPQMIMPDDIDRINAEWLVYQYERIPDEWFKKSEGYHSIDYYWKNVLAMKSMGGTDRFVSLGKLVKCALSLSHGNADVERGFSENAFLLSTDRSLLSDASINGLRATRDAVAFFGDGKPHEVPITKGLLDSVRNAHSRYCMDLEKQREELVVKKQIEEERIAKDLFRERENGLYDEQNGLYGNLADIQKLIDEGTERLAKAVPLKDFKEIETAQLLIEGGSRKLALTNTQIGHNNNQLNQLRKKRKK